MCQEKNNNLLDLSVDQEGIIEKISVSFPVKERLHRLGLIKGVSIKLVKATPWGSPRIYAFLHGQMAIRNNLAKKIKICLLKKSK